MINLLSQTLALGGFLLIAGCQTTQYHSYKSMGGQNDPPDRTVLFYASEDLAREFPGCVIIMPFLGVDRRAPGTIAMGRAFSRRLKEKISRVIETKERDKIAIKLAVSVDYHEDLELFANKVNCDTVFEVEVFERSVTSLIVWAAINIDVEARLLRIRPPSLLWRARHALSRTGGGLPLSGPSVITDSIEAFRIVSDPDNIESVLDDLARRLLVSLPHRDGGRQF